MCDRLPAYNSVMCEYFLLDLLILCLKVKSLQNLLIFLNYFKNR